MLFSAVIAIASLLLMWGFLAAVCVGLGCWYVLRRSPRRRLGGLSDGATLGDFAAAFWVGLATLLAVLQLWHFFAPINLVAHFCILLAGTLGFFLVIRQLWRAIRALGRKAFWSTAAALLLVLIWLANRATGPGAYYDAGLYHIAAIKWTGAYPIVPGLANLHMRFGFSSTLTLFSAMLNQGGWQGHANHVVNGFFLAALAAMTIRSTGLIVSRKNAAPQHWLMVFSALLIVNWALDVQIGSYSTDLGVAALTLAGAYYFLELFTVRSVPRAASAAAFVCVGLLAATITAKPSAIVLAAPMILVAWLVLWRARPERRWLAIVPSCAFALLLVAGWIAREIILTGYPLYPSEAFALPVDWAVPHEKVSWLRRIILDWARWQSYDNSRQSWSWLTQPSPTDPNSQPWIRSRILHPWWLWMAFIPTCIGAMALLAAGVRPFVARHRSTWRGPFWLVGCAALAAVAWWLTAPDPRYGSQIFILLMAGGMLLLGGPWLADAPAARIGFLLLAGVIAISPLLNPNTETHFRGARIAGNVWILPPEQGLFYPTPTSPYEMITTTSGLQVYVPSGSDDRIWDGPIPATPRSEIVVKEVSIPDLRLRRAGDLGAGFTRKPQGTTGEGTTGERR